MEIKGNKYGGEFEVNPSGGEIVTIMRVVGEIGMKGLSEDEIRQDPEIEAKMLAEIDESERWGRRTLEAVGRTLVEGIKTTKDTRELANLRALARQINQGLEEYPRL